MSRPPPSHQLPYTKRFKSQKHLDGPEVIPGSILAPRSDDKENFAPLPCPSNRDLLADDTSPPYHGVTPGLSPLPPTSLHRDYSISNGPPLPALARYNTSMCSILGSLLGSSPLTPAAAQIPPPSIALHSSSNSDLDPPLDDIGLPPPGVKEYLSKVIELTFGPSAVDLVDDVSPLGIAQTLLSLSESDGQQVRKIADSPGKFGYADKGCGCKNTNCLKLYCSCFQTSKMCNPFRCRCVDCRNVPQEMGQNGARTKAAVRILHRREDAFGPRVKSDSGRCSCKTNK